MIVETRTVHVSSLTDDEIVNGVAALIHEAMFRLLDGVQEGRDVFAPGGLLANLTATCGELSQIVNERIDNDVE